MAPSHPWSGSHGFESYSPWSPYLLQIKFPSLPGGISVTHPRVNSGSSVAASLLTALARLPVSFSTRVRSLRQLTTPRITRPFCLPDGILSLSPVSFQLHGPCASAPFHLLFPLLEMLSPQKATHLTPLLSFHVFSYVTFFSEAFANHKIALPPPLLCLLLRAFLCCAAFIGRLTHFILISWLSHIHLPSPPDIHSLGG